jgi:hypothetical protein
MNLKCMTAIDDLGKRHEIIVVLTEGQRDLLLVQCRAAGISKQDVVTNYIKKLTQSDIDSLVRVPRGEGDRKRVKMRLGTVVWGWVNEFREAHSGEGRGGGVSHAEVIEACARKALKL